MLPEKFLQRMQDMLGDEYEAFLSSYDRERYQALRVNTLKADLLSFPKSAPFHLSPVAWAADGFYYAASDHPGKHPYHEAGVYYIQEPSAMLSAALLEAFPGETVLDLCAAPGGKSTQIASAMQGEGLLVCNEIHPARAKILSENIERMGISNAVVLNESPQRLEEIFPNCFDRIMVDAPCSGEGMFFKNEEAAAQWSEENVRACADRQDEILSCAAKMLRPGGRLVYSTCTFSVLENEGSVERFLKRHGDFSLVKDVRLWPHRVKGEGHYAAVLVREGPVLQETRPPVGSKTGGGFTRESLRFQRECAGYLEFERQYLKEKLGETAESVFLRFGEQLYLCPARMGDMRGIKVLRPGLHLGTLKPNRFEPSHALAMALKPSEVWQSFALRSDEGRILDYLNGLTFPAKGQKGWHLITVDGYSTGWGKLADKTMKNHYPKGLRKCLSSRGLEDQEAHENKNPI